MYPNSFIRLLSCHSVMREGDSVFRYMRYYVRQGVCCCLSLLVAACCCCDAINFFIVLVPYRSKNSRS